MWEEINCWIDFLANWFEVVGFGLAIFTAIKLVFLKREVERIHTRHLYSVRIKDHISDLKKSTSKLSTLIFDITDSKVEIRVEISNCLVYCESVLNKSRDYEFKNLIPLISKLKKVKNNKYYPNEKLSKLKKILFNVKPISESELEIIYTDLNALITEIENFNNDLKKSIK